MLEKIKEFLEVFFQNVFNKSSNGLKEFSEKTGWIIDIEVIANFKLLYKLHELFEKNEFDKAKKLYRRYITNFYTSEKFEKIEQKWIQNPTLKNRVEILSQILQAHRMGMYYVSIPAILSQIEGYVWEFNEYKGRVEQKKLKAFLKNEEHLSIFAASLSNYIDKVILAPFDLSNELNSEISRNAILHGYDVRYGTREISLKLIIIMNVLQEFYMNLVLIKNDTIKLKNQLR